MTRIIRLSSLALSLALAGCSAQENALVETFINAAVEGGKAAKDNEARILTTATGAIGVRALLDLENTRQRCGAWIMAGGAVTDSPCAGVFVAPATTVAVPTGDGRFVLATVNPPSGQPSDLLDQLGDGAAP